jgi:quercetin dioxygenase-like cupin family protein
MNGVATHSRPAVVEFESALAALLQGAADERGGNPAVVERSGRHGEMTPLHVHPHDEVLYVVEGALTAFVGQSSLRLEAGHAILAPRAIPHTLLVESREARYLSATLARSVTRYEDFLRATAIPSEAPLPWEESGDASRVAALARPNGIQVLGPPGEIAGA